jgi:hypothetical protein
LFNWREDSAFPTPPSLRRIKHLHLAPHFRSRLRISFPQPTAESELKSYPTNRSTVKYVCDCSHRRCHGSEPTCDISSDRVSCCPIVIRLQFLPRFIKTASPTLRIGFLFHQIPRRQYSTGVANISGQAKNNGSRKASRSRTGVKTKGPASCSTELPSAIDSARFVPFWPRRNTKSFRSEEKGRQSIIGV